MPELQLPLPTDRNLSQEPMPKIPNVFKRWQPTELNSLPPDVQADSVVKVIFRSGMQPNGSLRAGDYFWGYANSSSDIVAYRVIKLESGWYDWGYRLERGGALNTQDGIPEGLNRQARVQVQLRLDDRPQRERVRLAHEWHWQVDGHDSSDIMRYRIVG